MSSSEAAVGNGALADRGGIVLVNPWRLAEYLLDDVER